MAEVPFRACVLAVAASVLLAGCTLESPRPSLAEALLLDGRYPTLVVEIDHDPAVPPSPAALAAFLKALESLTGKPQIRIVGPTPEPDLSPVGTRQDVLRMHRATMDHQPRGAGAGATAHLHVLFLDGLLKAGGDQLHTAGTTYASEGLIVVFPDAFSGAYHGVLGQRLDARDDVETVVLLHELGHALGLVDEGVPAVVPRSMGDGHSNNPASVMYPRLPLAGDGRVTRELPHGFDGHDIQDLMAFRVAHGAA